MSRFLWREVASQVYSGRLWSNTISQVGLKFGVVFLLHLRRVGSAQVEGRYEFSELGEGSRKMLSIGVLLSFEIRQIQIVLKFTLCHIVRPSQFCSFRRKNEKK